MATLDYPDTDLDSTSDTEIDEKSSEKPKRNAAWKLELTDKIVKGLKLDLPPLEYDKSAKLVFAKEPVDPIPTHYYIWDTNRDAPPGFGVKVAGKKTYILRRKVLGKSIMSKVGNAVDFDDLPQARARAREVARNMGIMGRNPNAAARERDAAEYTLGEAMAAYRTHLIERTVRPAKPETLRVFDRVVRKHDDWKWSEKKVREITPEQIVKKFTDTNKITPTATEQAFRWPSRAVEWIIENEKMKADIEQREPRLKANPFKTLAVNNFYRNQEMIDEEREEKGKRNPLRPSQDLGRFVEAAWSKKDMNDNRTGIDYLMLMLLWGCRKSEHAGLVWGDLLEEIGPPGKGRRTTSHVCLKDDLDWGPYVFFYKTKNGRSHRLPITPFALEILKKRQVFAAEEAVRRGFGSKSRQFVFPARSPLSRSGHYSDATDLLDDLREEINVDRLNRHDIRRSFGAVMTDLEVPETIKSRFLNHAKSKVTDLYTQAEWSLLRDWMSKIEQSILLKAPNAYNGLLPPGWRLIPAPPRHECRPPKPRTGRPAKAAKAAKAAAETALLKAAGLPKTA